MRTPKGRGSRRSADSRNRVEEVQAGKARREGLDASRLVALGDSPAIARFARTRGLSTAPPLVRR